MKENSIMIFLRRYPAVSLVPVALVGLLFLPRPSQGITITQAPIVDAITPSSARVIWMTDVASNTYIQYGLTTQYGFTSRGPSTQSTRAHAWHITGLAPGTEYHFSVCSKAGTDEVCSADQTFTTVSRPLGTIAEPRPPAVEVDTTMPEQAGATLIVGPDCDDPGTGLVARWNQAPWGSTVIIPTTTVCTGQYVFPAKAADTAVPHRWIVTRTSTPDDELPPPGTRLDPAVYGSKLSRVQTNRANIYWASRAGLPAPCIAGSFYWVTDDVRPFKLAQCVNAGTPKPVTAATGAGVSPIRLTVPNHGFGGQTRIYVKGINGNRAANGTFDAQVIDNSTLALYIPTGGPASGVSDYTSGGTVQPNQWADVPYTSGTSLPPGCQEGSWFVLGSSNPIDNVYRCIQPGVWTKWWMGPADSPKTLSAIDLGSTGRYLRFIGLEITHARPPFDPLTMQFTYNVFVQQNGWNFWQLINQGPGADHIIWDRCWIHGQSDTARTSGGINLDGSHVAIIDSTLNDLVQWSGTEAGSSGYEVTGIALGQGPGPALIRNNRIEALGIALFAPSDYCCVIPQEPNDVVVSRNDFFWDEKWRAGSPTWNGRLSRVRHHFELKFGRRWRIEGNRFTNTWATVNSGSAIALTPRAEPGTVLSLLSSVQNGVVTCLFNCPTVTPGEWITISNTSNPAQQTGWKVAEVLSARTFRVEGETGNSTSGWFNRMQAPLGLSDILITNNVFESVSNGIFIIGHTEGPNSPSMQLDTAARISVHNNLFASIDGQRGDAAGFLPNGSGGYAVYISNGMEDFSFTHNTIVSSRGNGNLALEYYNAHLPTGTGTPNSGLRYENNILVYGPSPQEGTINASGTAFGTLALNLLWQAGESPAWTYRNNIIARAGVAPTAAPFGPYPPNNYWHDTTTLGPIAYMNPGTGDFRLRDRYRNDFTCFAQPGDCSSSGTEPGVNMNELRAAMGAPMFASLIGGPRHALVQFTAPADAAPCGIRVANAAWQSLGSTLASAATRARSLLVPGLQPASDYQFTLDCGRSVALGYFRTAADNASSVPLAFAFRTPPFLNAAKALLLTGTSASTLSAQPVINCTGGRCNQSVSVARGVPLFYRHRFLSANDTVVAESSIMKLIP